MIIEIEQLLGRIVDRIENNEDEIYFHCNNGRTFKMYHSQDCCESVTVEDIAGDLNDLIGSPIILAEERSQQDPNAGESATWTFYELGTNKGTVTIRWYGSSNGYYSEEVSVIEVE